MSTIHGSMGYRLVHGTLSYRCAAGERGQERFTISVHGDGSRILRAMSEIYETRVLRDVSLRIGSDGCPRDAFVRLTVNDRFRGSGWFCFEADEAQGEALHAPASRVSQRVRLDGPVRSFGTHPITGDGWHAFLFDMDGPARQHFERLMISSYAFDGATGPELLPLGFGLEFVGIEDVTVPAGTLRARHFRFLLGGSSFDDHPAYDMWVTDDGDNVMVRARVGAPKDYDYELVSLERVER
jgi:hypothetical protein